MSPRWIYQVIEFKPGLMGGFKRDNIQEELNRQGMQGWELVNISMLGLGAPAFAVFKKAQ